MSVTTTKRVSPELNSRLATYGESDKLTMDARNGNALNVSSRAPSNVTRPFVSAKKPAGLNACVMTGKVKVFQAQYASSSHNVEGWMAYKLRRRTTPSATSNTVPTRSARSPSLEPNRAHICPGDLASSDQRCKRLLSQCAP